MRRTLLLMGRLLRPFWRRDGRHGMQGVSAQTVVGLEAVKRAIKTPPCFHLPDVWRPIAAVNVASVLRIFTARWAPRGLARAAEDAVQPPLDPLEPAASASQTQVTMDTAGDRPAVCTTSGPAWMPCQRRLARPLHTTRERRARAVWPLPRPRRGREHGMERAQQHRVEPRLCSRECPAPGEERNERECRDHGRRAARARRSHGPARA